MRFIAGISIGDKSLSYELQIMIQNLQHQLGQQRLKSEQQLSNFKAGQGHIKVWPVSHAGWELTFLALRTGCGLLLRYPLRISQQLAIPLPANNETRAINYR